MIYIRTQYHVLINKIVMCQPELNFTMGKLTGCLYGGKPALLVGLALVGELNFTLLLHGNFLAPLAGLDLESMYFGRASTNLTLFMWNISSPPLM